MHHEKHSGAGRYAPSPSGDLHLGNLRTALLAWLFARSTGRSFVMRVEDLDRARDQGSAATQLEHLVSLGLDWDGPVVWQTERLDAYADIVRELDEAGRLYECYCTRREILEAPVAPHQPPGNYPGTCRDLSESEQREARRRIAPRSAALRLRFDEPHREISFTDGVRGETTGAIDDFVIMRGDGAYAYNFVAVVDDAWQGVDQVVRGDDLLASTPRHIALQRLLGYAQPEYHHVPLVLGPDQKRLAKRDGAVTLPELIEQGETAQSVLSLLGSSLGLNEQGARVTTQQLLERFDEARLPRDPWVWHPASRR